MIPAISFSSNWNKFTSMVQSAFGAMPSLPNTDDYKKNFESDPVAKWGSDNMFPKLLDEAVKKTDVVEAVLQDLTCFAYQSEVGAFERKIVNNKLVYVPIVFEPLEALRSQCDLDEYFEKAFYDYFRYGNAWAQPIMDESRSKFVFLSAIDAPLCRNQKKNPKTKLSEHVYVTGQWSTSLKIGKEIDPSMKDHIDLVPTITKLDTPLTIKDRKEVKYMMHIADYSPGNVYYGEAPWHTLLRNEWLQVNANIPVKLNAFYEKAIQLNYHVELDYETLFESLNGPGTWITSPYEKKEAFINEYHAAIHENLKGEDKSYTSIFTEFKTQKSTGESRSAVKIKVLESFAKDSHIPEAQQSISEIMLAMRYDPSLINSGMFGSKLGAGSGSDKDQGFKLLDVRMNLARKKILKPLEFMMKYNAPSNSNIVLAFQPINYDFSQANGTKTTTT